MKKILITIGVLALVGGAFFGGMYFMNEQKSTKHKSPEQLKYELKQKEGRLPNSYLKIETDLENNIKKGGLFKKAKVDGQIIKGTIKNTATAATYKDVVVELSFYSKTKTEIGKKKFVIYEQYPPNITKKFQYKIEIPQATKTYNARIATAQPVY